MNLNKLLLVTIFLFIFSFTSYSNELFMDKQIDGKTEVVKLIGQCKAIKSTGKRHNSYVFTFQVKKVIEGKYQQPYITFEVFQGFGGGKLIKAVNGNVAEASDDGTISSFDSKTDFILTFDEYRYGTIVHYVLTESDKLKIENK